MASSQVEIWDLPDEVLCYIFFKLEAEHVIKHVMNVCQRWKSIVAENRIFWNNTQLVIDCDYFMNYSYLDEKVKSSDLHMLQVSEGQIFIGEKDLEKVPKVQNIKFANGSRIMNQSVSLLISILDVISKKCQNIDKVEFSSCIGAASKKAIISLRDKYSCIKEISYGVNYFDMYMFPCEELSGFTNLKILVLHDFAFKSSDLLLISEKCEYLDSLWILLCQLLMPKDILYFLEKKKHILKELGIFKSEDFILDKLQECHNLEVFYSTDASRISDDCLTSFAYHSSLKYCSLHEAKFRRTAVFEVAGPKGNPECFEHLLVLDLTGYHNYNALVFDSWEKYWKTNANLDGKGPSSKAFVEITFTNSSLRSIKEPRYSLAPTTNEHWMYRYRNVRHVPDWKKRVKTITSRLQQQGFFADLAQNKV